MMMSLSDQRMIVLRNGIEIGRSRIFVGDIETPVGTHAFIVKAGEGSGESVLLKGAAARNWMEVPMPGYGGTTGNQLGKAVVSRMRLPQDFAKLLYPQIIDSLRRLPQPETRPLDHARCARPEMAARRAWSIRVAPAPCRRTSRTARCGQAQSNADHANQGSRRGFAAAA